MADKSVFTRLKRLFSTDVIIRNVGGNQLKVIDTNSIQKAGELETNSLTDRFARLYTTSQYPYNNIAFNYQTMRIELYGDYEAMDTDAIIASALDIIADESTLKDDMGEVLSIKSPDEDIQKVLYNLFYDVLNIEFNLWMWVRQMCKYGDFFLKLEIAEKYGVYNVIPYTAYNISRIEGSDPDNPSQIVFQYDPNGMGAGGTYGGYGTVVGLDTNNGNYIYFDNYEMAHFRLLADANYLPYGRSYIEPARKLYKQYSLMEDAMLVHRIVRAPEKRIYYINVGGIPPNEVDAFMEKTVSKMKRAPYIDEETGDYNLKYNMQNMMEDFFIPVRGNDSATKIDTTKGLDYDGIADVEYLRDKLFAALKVPKAFLGYDESVEGKATLAAEDIRFGRTIDRIQRIVTSELYKIATVHLYTQGYTGEQLSNFELTLTTPSIIYDQERIALMKEKVDLAAQMIETKLLPTDWIYDNIFRFSENEYDEYRDLISEDAKRRFRLNQIEAEGNDPVETGKSYGTPHDLASLYGKGRYDSDPTNVPDGYDQGTIDPKLGRPKEKVSNRNTQDSAFGKDRLGAKGMKKDMNEPKSSYKGKSPLALETLLSKIPMNTKKLVFENDNKGESLLDESNIKEQ
tara:strand:+ start:1486 stop:3366 length:1881 start_codon:yes stop_codon:yes gene_type:complete